MTVIAFIRLTGLVEFLVARLPEPLSELSWEQTYSHQSPTVERGVT